MPSISLTVRTDDMLEADLLARQLRNELQALDLDEIDFESESDTPPDGAKGLDPATVTTVVVAVTSSRVLVQLGRVLQDFVNRGRHRKIVVRDGKRSVEIVGGAVDDYEQLLEVFLQRK